MEQLQNGVPDRQVAQDLPLDNKLSSSVKELRTLVQRISAWDGRKSAFSVRGVVGQSVS